MTLIIINQMFIATGLVSLLGAFIAKNKECFGLLGFLVLLIQKELVGYSRLKLRVSKK